MTDLLPLNADELLTTTRSVRRRLDLDRPVPIEVVREALQVAMQAPSGRNTQPWHWIVVVDPDIRRAIADFYRRAFDRYRDAQPQGDDTARRVASSVEYLAEVIDRVPVLVIGALDVEGDLPDGNQAALWGSLLPGAWSLALALRARGLGSAWTTLHLVYEKEVAELLGIPPTVRQGVLLPVAWTKGIDFSPAPRGPLDDVVHMDRW